MAEAGEKVDSLRLNRFETKRLLWALVLSLLAHFLIWGGYELGKKYDLWQRWHWLARLQSAKKKIPPPVVQETEPTIFLAVDPDQVSPEPPKDAKYYSVANSRAANPDADRDLNQPKLTGKQADIPKVRDVPRIPNSKPQPALQPPSPQSEQQHEQPKPTEQPGEMKLAKLDVSPEKRDAPEKPRTLNEARALQSNPMPSISMQQDGGVRRRAVVPSFDVKLTGFAEYDARFYEAVCQRWWDLLDSRQFARDRSGKVTLQFRLKYDGTITDMQVLQNDVGEVLGIVCQKAVFDPAPFAHFPSDMRLKLGDYASIRFSFYYY